MSGTRPPHPALAARILTVGLSVAAATALVALFDRDSRRSSPDSPARLVEVRIGDQVDDDAARRALQAWLDGDPDLTVSGDLTVVDLPADTESEPS